MNIYFPLSRSIAAVATLLLCTVLLGAGGRPSSPPPRGKDKASTLERTHEGQAPIRGKVLSVADGDTLIVLAKDGSRQRLRLYGVDSPESRQTGGEEASKFTRSLALEKEVKVTVMDRDRYQRAVSIVTLPDRRILNEELVRAGHAWVFKQFCDAPQCSAWKALQTQARRENRGLWAMPNPEPPQKWRGRHPRNEQ